MAKQNGKPQENERGLLEQGGVVIEYAKRDHPEHTSPNGSGPGSEADLADKVHDFEYMNSQMPPDDSGQAEAPLRLVPIETLNIQRVRCTVPGYEGVTVLYRTSVDAARRRSRPRFDDEHDYSAETRQARAESARLWTVAEAQDRDKAPNDPASPEALESVRLANLANDLAATDIDRFFRERFIPWLSSFVVGFEWNLARTVGYTEDGERILEPLPAPRVGDPESYYDLFLNHQPLWAFLPDEGWAIAVKQAVGVPFGRASGRIMAN